MNPVDELRKKLSEVEEAYHKAKDRFDSATTAASAAEAGERLPKIEARYWQLRKLVERIDDAEEVTEREIAEVLGQPAPAAPKAVPTLRLPMRLTTPEERKEYRQKAKKRASGPDELSEDQRRRYEEISASYWADAFACIEGMIESQHRIVDKVGRKIGKGDGFANHPVTFTQGQSIALVVTLARLWTDSRAAVKFNREQRLLLEQRVAALEARPVFEDVGVWSADKGYRNGNGVSHDGSFWLAKRDTLPGERPGACDGFRLAVKRGRDGKNAA